MAYSEMIHCHACGDVQWHTNDHCDGCLKREKLKEEIRWRELPIEAKVEELKKRLDSIRTEEPRF